MAKKAASSDFNMSEVIRELLIENPNLTSQGMTDAVMAKYPGAKINKNSFSVAFYTARKKMGIGQKGKSKKVGDRISKPQANHRPARVNADTMHSAVKFLREVGNIDDALAAIKQVQAVQLK